MTSTGPFSSVWRYKCPDRSPDDPNSQQPETKLYTSVPTNPTAVQALNTGSTHPDKENTPIPVCTNLHPGCYTGIGVPTPYYGARPWTLLCGAETPEGGAR